MAQTFSGICKWIFRRRGAYRALFQPGGNLTPAAEIVLADLRKFCRATTSTTVVSPVTGNVDPIASAQAEGRREVYLRIIQNLLVSDQDLYRVAEREQDEERETFT